MKFAKKFLTLAKKENMPCQKGSSRMLFVDLEGYEESNDVYFMIEKRDRRSARIFLLTGINFKPSCIGSWERLNWLNGNLYFCKFIKVPLGKQGVQIVLLHDVYARKGLVRETFEAMKRLRETYDDNYQKIKAVSNPS